MIQFKWITPTIETIELSDLHTFVVNYKSHKIKIGKIKLLYRIQRFQKMLFTQYYDTYRPMILWLYHCREQGQRYIILWFYDRIVHGIFLTNYCIVLENNSLLLYNSYTVD